MAFYKSFGVSVYWGSDARDTRRRRAKVGAGLSVVRVAIAVTLVLTSVALSVDSGL